MAIVERKTAKVVAVLGNRPAGQPGHIIRGIRKNLRLYLSQNLNVRTGKAFSHYEESHDGVTAFFKDGSSAKGSILVAADGAYSKVRAQLLNDPEDVQRVGTTPQPSAWISIFGECTLSKDLFEPLSDISSAGLLSATDTTRFMIAPTTFDPSGQSVSYYWSVAFLGFDPPAEASWIQTASAQSLYDRAIHLTEGSASVLTDVIHATGPSGMMVRPPRFVEWVPPKRLPRGRVTLLGDAAHTMIPFKGVGANTAIRDACDLAKLLVESVRREGGGEGGGYSVDWILKRYEGPMLERGREMVLSTRESGRDANGVMDALKGRVNTHADEVEVEGEKESVAVVDGAVGALKKLEIEEK